MTALELKAQIKQQIENEQDPVILEKFLTYYRKLKNADKNIPSQYTLGELHSELDKAEDDVCH